MSIPERHWHVGNLEICIIEIKEIKKIRPPPFLETGGQVRADLNAARGDAARARAEKADAVRERVAAEKAAGKLAAAGADDQSGALDAKFAN